MSHLIKINGELIYVEVFNCEGNTYAKFGLDVAKISDKICWSENSGKLLEDYCKYKTYGDGSQNWEYIGRVSRLSSSGLL